MTATHTTTAPPRIVIAGGPRSGKSTLANALGFELDYKVRHLDDLMRTHDWSSASEHASHWFDEPGPWIIEGVQAVRALRKWLKRAPDERVSPCDRVALLMDALVPLIKGQESMRKGVATVWDEIRPGLEARQVEIWQDRPRLFDIEGWAL